MLDQDRVRVELRVAKGLVAIVDELSTAIGLRRNAIFVLAVSRFAVDLMTLHCQLTGAKRNVLFDRLEKELLTALEDARKTL